MCHVFTKDPTYPLIGFHRRHSINETLWEGWFDWCTTHAKWSFVCASTDAFAMHVPGGGGSVFSSGGDVQGCVDTKVGSKNNKIPRVLGNRAVLPWHLVNLHLFRAEDQHARRVKSCAQAAKASKKKGKK